MAVLAAVLLAWSGIALLWWCVSLWLVSTARRPEPAPTLPPRPTLTVFKALPPARRESDRLALAGAVESFLLQLDEDSQLLIGVEEPELAQWKGIFDRWRSLKIGGQWLVQALPVPATGVNPKIAKFRNLATRAQGECWLWSDADIIAPLGLLDRLRGEVQASGSGAVTCAYAVRALDRGPAILDALFANVEFLPGALLLGRRGSLALTFGAAAIFRAEDFHQRVSWAELQVALADDYVLGQRLRPVALSHHRVETLVLTANWRDALQHYYRWHKTIRWCRPGGYAALLTITPFLGWLTMVLCRPDIRWTWTGLAFQSLAEIGLAATILRNTGCPIPRRAWAGLCLWPFVRALTWLAAWLPIPVLWGEKGARWNRPRHPRK